MRERRVRRVAGLLRARLPELGLENVPDARARDGRWSLAQILRAALLGLMAGCRSLAETEELSESLSPAARRMVGLPRRLADTTARDALCKVSFDGLRAVLHRLVRAAWRRKALAPVGLPLGVVALDGKVTALPTLNHPHVQNQISDAGVPYGLVRTVTCALVSAAGRPCIDAIPIPAATNEMGHFQAAFASVVKTYGALFQMVTYDAGALSQANGAAVVEAGKDYLFALKDEHRTMFKLASELLDPHDAAARTIDVLDNQTTVTRTLTLLPWTRAPPMARARGRRSRSGDTPGRSCRSTRPRSALASPSTMTSGSTYRAAHRRRSPPTRGSMSCAPTVASRTTTTTPSTPRLPRTTGRGSRPTSAACSRCSCSAASRTPSSPSSGR